jgi:hypothetical protein
MRRQVGTLLGLALITPVVIAPSIPASAATATAQVAITKADDPYSVFKISSVRYTKKVKPGGWLKYSFTATNTGPYEADYYWIGGILPKGIDHKGTLYWNGPKGSKCYWEDREFWCWTPHILKADESDRLSFWLKLSKKATGTQVAKIGAINYDVPRGAEDLDKERLKDLGIKGWLYAKTVKTKVIKAKPKPHYNPPPPPVVNPPRNHHSVTDEKPT